MYVKQCVCMYFTVCLLFYQRSSCSLTYSWRLCEVVSVCCFTFKFYSCILLGHNTLKTFWNYYIYLTLLFSQPHKCPDCVPSLCLCLLPSSVVYSLFILCARPSIVLSLSWKSVPNSRWVRSGNFSLRSLNLFLVCLSLSLLFSWCPVSLSTSVCLLTRSL